MQTARRSIDALTSMLSLAVAAVLLVFNVRRVLFLAVAIADLAGKRSARVARSSAAGAFQPEVLILAPLRWGM